MKQILAATFISFTTLSSYGLSEPLAPARPGTLFSDVAIKDVELTARFQELFAKKHAPDARTFYVDGFLSFKDAQDNKVKLEVKVRTKGRSTRECSFPKLELKIAEQSAKSTVFDGIRSVDLNTHCAQPSDPTVYAPLKASFNNHREVLIYRMMEILRMPALKAKAIKIKYYDLAENAVNPEAPANTYDAFFLQDFADLRIKNNLVELIGAPQEGEIKINPEAPSKSLAIFQDVSQMGAAMDHEDILRLATFEFLIGNEDWFLLLDKNDGYTKLWNTKVFQLSNGKAFPVPYDFNFSRLFQGMESAYEIRSNFLSFADTKTKSKVFKFFLEKKSEIIKAVQESHDPNPDKMQAFLEASFSRIEHYLSELPK